MAIWRIAPDLERATVSVELAGLFKEVVLDQYLSGLDLVRIKAVRLGGLDDGPGELNTVVGDVVDVVALECAACRRE